jgi:RsmE family RNA methyltransferase
MNMVLFEEHDLVSENVALISDKRRLDQLNMVIKAEVGKFCKAGMLGGKVGRAEILEITAGKALFSLALEDAPPPPLDVVLVAALPRPLTFAKVVHGAVTAGVKHICFIHSRKVEKSYWQSSKISPDELRMQLILALEQCADTVMPKIEFHQHFKPFFEDRLPQLCDRAFKIIGSPSATARVPVGAALKEKVLLAVGPEGGFSEYEENRFAEAGFLPVSLGKRILRTEFALASLLSLLGAETNA